MKNIILPAAALLGLLAASPAQTVLIDFGNNATFRGVTSPGNWNSMGFGFVSNLVDSDGNATTIDWAPDGLGGVDSYNSIVGPTSNPPSAGEILAAQNKLGGSLGPLALGQAAIDFFQSNNGTSGVGRFQLQQVTAGQLYNLTFYGTKQFVSAGNEQTRYSVFYDNSYSNLLGTGLLTTSSTDNTGNPNNVLTLENLVGPANANNIFYIQWEGANTSTAGYINSMSIETVPEPSTYALLAVAGAAFAGYRLRRRAR
jgi:hypothetical protein